jgi:transcriptional regulator with XRE-family HTH domain
MTWMRKRRSKDISLRQYDEQMFSSSIVGLFWNILSHRGMTLTQLAELVGVNKSQTSRWFNDEKPNFESNSMVAIADALGVDLELYARDRKTGRRFAPYGIEHAPTTVTRELPTGMDNKTSSVRSRDNELLRVPA